MVRVSGDSADRSSSLVLPGAIYQGLLGSAETQIGDCCRPYPTNPGLAELRTTALPFARCRSRGRR